MEEKNTENIKKKFEKKLEVSSNAANETKKQLIHQVNEVRTK